jgi:2-dehydropantoate 2-reductase
MNKNLIVIGLGGVGGYFGFKIAQNNPDRKKNKTTFVARGETFETVRENGLTLLSSEHPNQSAKPDFLVQNIEEIAPPADLILICVKEYDLENVCLELKKITDENSVILPLMNGVDIYERIRKIIKNAVVLPACVYVASHIKAKGIVEHKGKPGKIIFGRDPQKPGTGGQWIDELLKKSGIDATCKEDAFPDIWTKFVFIAAFGLVSARFNKSIGQVAEEPELRERATEIMREITGIADKKGVSLSGDIIELTFEKAAAFPFDTPTSLQLDVRSGKAQNELELFAGAILKYGKETETSVDATAKIYREIKTYAEQSIFESAARRH